MRAEDFPTVREVTRVAYAQELDGVDIAKIVCFRYKTNEGINMVVRGRLYQIHHSRHVNRRLSVTIYDESLGLNGTVNAYTTFELETTQQVEILSEEFEENED